MDKKSDINSRTDIIYILWPGKTEEDCIYEICQLGQFSYPKKQLEDNKFTRKHVFTKLEGFSILEKVIAKERMDILEHSKIISNTGKKYTVEQFLTLLENGVELK